MIPGIRLVLGCQTTSSEYTVLPSITAETFRSEPPASKPMRQPFQCPPILRAPPRGAGRSASDTASNTKGR